MELKVKKINGFYTVNEKRIEDLNVLELEFLNSFFREIKIKQNESRV